MLEVPVEVWCLFRIRAESCVTTATSSTQSDVKSDGWQADEMERSDRSSSRSTCSLEGGSGYLVAELAEDLRQMEEIGEEVAVRSSSKMAHQELAASGSPRYLIWEAS